MRARLAWLLGGIALARLLLGRRRPAALPARRPIGEPAADPRAAELRAKLAESKPIVGERAEDESAEPPAAAAELGLDLDERRRQVHETGRAAAERMRRDASASE